MNTTAFRRPTRTGLVGSLVAAVTLTVVAAGNVSAAEHDGATPPPRSHSGATTPQRPHTDAGIARSAAEALAERNGISVAAAAEQLAGQRAADRLADRIGDELGVATAGSYLSRDGDLVVAATSKAAARVAQAEGADRTRVVDDPVARLDRIQDRLDALAKKNGAGSVQSWAVDIPSNTVVVTVTRGADDRRSNAIVRLARSFGDAVRIESAPASQMPTSTAYLYGGVGYVTPSGGSCSVGFNTVDAWNRNVVLTAGHCVNRSGMTSRNGYYVGATRTANFPVDDFGTIWNAYPSYWRPLASVAKYNGTVMPVRGQWNTPPIGATVCKSGRTTGWTCGVIQAHNQTVNLDGQLVYGLTRHNACVEPGDSGGSNISAGGYALGVTSGASLYRDNNGRFTWCGARRGYANVSWYQPIGEALSRNGLRLLVAR